MQFQVASDIHIEKLYPQLSGILDFLTPSAENLILAGDIGSIYQYEAFKHFFTTCKANFKHIIFVPGNNEYYSREGFESKSMTELNEDMARLCEETGIYLLNNAYIELEDLIIFGSTWWSYIPDFLNIRININSTTKMTPDDFNFLHAASRRCLNWLLEYNKQKNKKLLVITHYCPTKLGTMQAHHRKDDFIDLIPYYFASSEKYLKKELVHTWIFGHTHVFRDFLFNNDQTRIVSNADPRKRFFKRSFTLEI